MSLKRPTWSPGRLVTLEHTSGVLADNPLGDPHVRTLEVWLPPQYDRGAAARGKRFPVLFDLVGYTGSGRSHTNWRNFSENLVERAARLAHQRRMGPCILVFPDCFTALGGNQYINSSAIGRYADYLTKELIPFVDREFRTLATRDHRGCFGKSSGGYGAIVHGMRYSRYWGAVADHSGDSYFDFVYRADWPNTLNEIAKYRAKKRRPGAIRVPAEGRRTGAGTDDGRIQRFLDHIWKTDRPTQREVLALMNLCMAATYDPDPKAPLGFRVPFDLETGEILPDRWRNWLKHDPIHMVGRYAKALRSLRGIWIDCGWRDQFHIHYGTRLLSKALHRHRIEHTYEEFDDTHSDIDYRMDRSLPFLWRAIRP